MRILDEVSCGNAVGIATKLRPKWLGFDSWQGRYFSLRRLDQIGFWIHLPSYQISTWDPITRGKAASI
jgi:hypothetical protein